MRNKRGANSITFILIVLIVVVVAIGVYFYTNGFSIKSSEINLNERYQVNGSVVLYGTFSGTSLTDHIEEFSKINAAGNAEGKKTHFVFVNSDGEAVLSEFEELNQGEFNLALGNSNEYYQIKQNQYQEQKLGERNNVEVLVNGETYNFNLKPEDNAYFVIQEG